MSYRSLFRIVTLAVCFSFCSACKEEEKPAGSIRIIAWNLEWFPGKNPGAKPPAQQEHMTQVQTALAQVKPDILMVEEVKDLKSVEDAVSVLPGMKVHIVSRFKQGRSIGQQQQGVISRYAADSAFAEEWKKAPQSPPRGFSFAAVALPSKTILLTYAVHLKSNRGSDAEREQNIAKREESARQLVEHVKSMQKVYADKRMKTAVIIGGDFNLLETPEFAHEKTRQILIDAGFDWSWEGVPFKDRITWPPAEGYDGACFDHFFTKGLGDVKAIALPLDGASDHRPIQLVITSNIQ